jgi:hypothetical protein
MIVVLCYCTTTIVLGKEAGDHPMRKLRPIRWDEFIVARYIYDLTRKLA